MKVLVTGASGFIGSRVVGALIPYAHSVRCLVRPTSRTDRLQGLPIEISVGDLDDPGSLLAAAEGCDACIHLAGISGWSAQRSSDLENSIVGATTRLLFAARTCGVRRFVYVSSASAIDGAPRPVLLDEQSAFSLAGTDLHYALAKRRAEQLALASATDGFEVVVVNPAEVYGPYDRDWITAGSIRDLLKSVPAMVVRGGTSIVHVDDVANGIAAALRQGRSGQRYILGGDNLTLAEIASLALSLAGLRRRVIVVPFWMLRLAVAAAQALGLRPPVEPALVPYLDRYWFMDSAKARRDLGFAPRSALATLEPVVRWICEQQGAGAGQRQDIAPARSGAG